MRSVNTGGTHIGVLLVAVVTSVQPVVLLLLLVMIVVLVLLLIFLVLLFFVLLLLVYVHLLSAPLLLRHEADPLGGRGGCVPPAATTDGLGGRGRRIHLGFRLVTYN